MSYAAYTPDGGTTWVSAFQNRQTLFRAVACHDFALRRPSLFSVMTGVRPSSRLGGEVSSLVRPGLTCPGPDWDGDPPRRGIAHRPAPLARGLSCVGPGCQKLVLSRAGGTKSDQRELSALELSCQPTGHPCQRCDVGGV